MAFTHCYRARSLRRRRRRKNTEYLFICRKKKPLYAFTTFSKKSQFYLDVVTFFLLFFTLLLLFNKPHTISSAMSASSNKIKVSIDILLPSKLHRSENPEKKTRMLSFRQTGFTAKFHNRKTDGLKKTLKAIFLDHINESVIRAFLL